MKRMTAAGFLLLFLLIAGACSERPVTDPPQLSEKWITAYDPEAKGISESWYTVFPETKFTGSTWDDWQMVNARYRWHKQRFMAGALDSAASYLLDLNTVASPTLIWLNGKLVDQVGFSDRTAVGITSHLLPHVYNELVIRNEYKDDSFGINRIGIIKAPQETTTAESERDYFSMPLYHDTPSYANDMIIYEAFVRNISPTGTFTGLQNTISRLDQLGINMVRLMPIHPIGVQNKTGSLGSPYAVRDHFTTNSRYGSLPQFASLRSMLHRNNIRVMLDAVMDRSAMDHPWVKDYPSYYRRDENGNPVPVDRDSYMLDYVSEPLRGRMISYFDFWVEQGVDAFLCTGSARISGDFIQQLRDHFTNEGFDPFLAADGMLPDQVLYGLDALDGERLYTTFRSISEGKSDATSIGRTLAEEIRACSEGTMIIHYAENHATPRAMKTFGVDGHHLALFTIFSAPGIPMIHCGEELNDPPFMELGEKTEINWYDIHWPTYNLISKLSRFRKNSPVLTNGNLTRIADTKSVGGFSRRYRNETWFILMNYSNTEQLYQCDVKTTVFSDGTSGVIRNGRVKLKPKGYCIVK